MILNLPNQAENDQVKQQTIVALMIDQTEFESFYKEKLDPLMPQLKKEARGTDAWGYAIFFFLILIILAAYWHFQLNKIENIGTVFLLLFIGIGISIYNYGTRANRFDDDYRNLLIREIINHILPGTTYLPDSCINEVNYKKSCLCRYPYSAFEGSDLMKGNYKGVNFHCSQVESADTNTIDSVGVSTDATDIFNGLFLIVPISNGYSGGTYIWPRGGEQLPVSIMDEAYRLMPMPRTWDVPFNDPAFNEYFRVCSTYPDEAREILTPVIRAKMVALTEEFDRMVAFSYVAGTFNFAFPFKGDMFDDDGSAPDDKEQIRFFFERVNLIPHIIDELELFNLQ